VAALAAAGCGSGGSYGNSGGGNASSPSPAASVTPARAPALSVKKTSLGKVLVDAKGRTLYLFGADTKDRSNCTGACAGNWPPAAAPKKPKVGAGVSKRKLRVIKRSDGTRQLSYAGHPLYRFAGDGKSGDLKGQNVDAFGGVWNVVAPGGSAVTGAPKKQEQQPAPTPTPGYGGY
jgi:predicted lipoprotein with Yx(FWY)xxD motif